jgi:putative acetyltransferase
MAGHNERMQIRCECAADVDQIRQVNRAAFGTTAEADLVDTLRRRVEPFISLVAEEGGLIAGHILFSPVTLSSDEALPIAGLAPMAVLPPWQRHGIGSALVHAGLDECRRFGFRASVVLGHPDFYPRFGFVPASRFGISSTYDVPDDVFMALELEPGALQAKSGLIRYDAAFAEVS